VDWSIIPVATLEENLHESFELRNLSNINISPFITAIRLARKAPELLVLWADGRYKDSREEAADFVSLVDLR
jgi:hypothetical protein